MVIKVEVLLDSIGKVDNQARHNPYEQEAA
jgi:hypothetical protein